MDIVLLEDVKSLGKKGQLVKVNDGYARNFILPKKLGVEATAKNLNDLKLQKACIPGGRAPREAPEGECGEDRGEAAGRGKGAGREAGGPFRHDLDESR